MEKVTLLQMTIFDLASIGKTYTDVLLLKCFCFSSHITRKLLKFKYIAGEHPSKTASTHSKAKIVVSLKRIELKLRIVCKLNLSWF